MQDAKKRRYVRTVTTIVFTLVVVGAVIGIMFAVDSCEGEVLLDMGETFERGDESVTPVAFEVYEDGGKLYVFFEIEGKNAQTGRLALDGQEPCKTCADVAAAHGIELFDGEKLDGKGTVCFVIDERSYESELTYRNAVFRVGILRP